MPTGRSLTIDHRLVQAAAMRIHLALAGEREPVLPLNQTPRPC